MNDKTLLPCPFCGRDAQVREDDGKFCIVCNHVDCWCAYGEGYDGYAMPDHSFDNRETAIEKWNTRTPSPDGVRREFDVDEEPLIESRDIVDRLRYAASHLVSRDNYPAAEWMEEAAAIISHLRGYGSLSKPAGEE